MKPNRRDLLRGLGGLGALSACGADALPEDTSVTEAPPVPAPERPAEPEPWQAGGTRDDVAFPATVQSGDATANAVLLQVRTDEPDLTLAIVVQDGDSWADEREVQGLEPVDGVLSIEVEGLQPDTAYQYTFYADESGRRSAVGRFRTALGPDSPARKITFGATSCLGGVNPEWGSLSHVAALRPDFFLLLGDTVYADGSYTAAEYRAEWAYALGKASLQDVCTQTSLVGTWDDHEVENNWLLGITVTAEQYANAVAEFRAAIPMRVGPGGSGLWRKLSWGSVLDIFVLDSRGERDIGHIVSEEQLNWVTAELAASTARFKMVLCSVHLTDHKNVMGSVEAEDRWQGYPHQREPLIAALAAAGGAMVVTGDMHFGAVQELGGPTEVGEGIPEVAAGPGGSTIFPMGAITSLAVDDPVQYLELVDTWSTCWFELDPGLGTLTVAFIDDAGETLATRTLNLPESSEA